MASKVAVKIGQVWRESDKRAEGRTVTVLGFGSSVDRWDGHRYRHANVQNAAGRKTKIRLDRLDGKQYVLVERADA